MTPLAEEVIAALVDLDTLDARDVQLVSAALRYHEMLVEDAQAALVECSTAAVQSRISNRYRLADLQSAFASVAATIVAPFSRSTPRSTRDVVKAIGRMDTLDARDVQLVSAALRYHEMLVEDAQAALVECSTAAVQSRAVGQHRLADMQSVFAAIAAGLVSDAEPPPEVKA